MKNSFPLFLIALLAFGNVFGQHYSAIHGSRYFGSLNVYNNPSTIVNSPYKWDVTLFGTQFSAFSNGLRGNNFPLYLTPGATFTVANGNYARKLDANYNVRLLNARYSISKTQALAFGLNFRGYAQGFTSRINYSDSVKGALSFLSRNEQNRMVNVNLASSSWMELYGSYGLTLLNTEAGKLTGGVTLKILRGMSGAFARADDIGIEKVTENDRVAYRVANGSARYGYSANHGDGSSFSAGDLFSGAKTGFAFDLGVEYVIKTQAVSSVYDEEDDNDYEWKIGFSLLDIGANKFVYGSESRQASSLKENVTGAVLQGKFFSIKSLPAFNDSLSTIVNEYVPLTGNFRITNPMRAVVNADRYVSGNFYVNGQLSVNLAASRSGKPAVQEISLLTVTPRWEKKKFGFYLPVEYTRHGNFWIGGALRAGPLLLGTHNLLNAFSKNNYLSGGGYLAIIIRPMNFMRDPRNRQYDCPAY